MNIDNIDRKVKKGQEGETVEKCNPLGVELSGDKETGLDQAIPGL